MRETFGEQQGDAWRKWRVGRVTASNLAFVCDRLTRASGDKKKGDYSSKRDLYFWKLAYERQSGRSADNAPTYWMERGTALEESARTEYSSMVKEPVEQVGFVVHPEMDFFGASLDSLVGSRGGLEIKCYAGPKHLRIIKKGEDPCELIAQVGGEMMCSQREWIDKFLFCPDLIALGSKRSYRARFTVDNLVWIMFDGEILSGKKVLDYFQCEVRTMELDLQNYMRDEGITPVAPYEPKYIDGKLETEAPDPGYDASKGFDEQDYSFLDAGADAP